MKQINVYLRKNLINGEFYFSKNENPLDSCEDNKVYLGKDRKFHHGARSGGCYFDSIEQAMQWISTIKKFNPIIDEKHI